MECSDCNHSIDQYVPQDGSALVSYQQWENGEKGKVVATAEDTFRDLRHQLKQFLIHVYVKRKQSAYFEKVKGEVNGINVVLQVDFSENASLVQQNEIQAGHWNHKQATLFTAYA